MNNDCHLSDTEHISNVISKFPNSNKTPASYLKQAMAFMELKKNDAAKQRLNELITIYPKAAEAKRAQSILKTL